MLGCRMSSAPSEPAENLQEPAGNSDSSLVKWSISIKSDQLSSSQENGLGTEMRGCGPQRRCGDGDSAQQSSWPGSFGDLHESTPKCQEKFLPSCPVCGLHLLPWLGQEDGASLGNPAHAFNFPPAPERKGSPEDLWAPCSSCRSINSLSQVLGTWGPWGNAERDQKQLWVPPPLPSPRV